MSRHEIAEKKVLLTVSGMESVRIVRTEFRGSDGQPLPVALHYPPTPTADPLPAVVIVEGYPDAGFVKLLGCMFMDMEWSIGIARLIAASGMIAVTYSNRQPPEDASAMLDHLQSNAATIGVDRARIGLWATSGHGPLAISMLQRGTCAVLSNPYTLDLDGATHVTEASKMFRFVVPAGSTFPPERPIFVVRAGKDEMPGLNVALDRFVAKALELNRPMMLVNHPEAPHSYDLFHDSATTRHILGQALAFLAFHLELSHTGGDLGARP